MGWYQLLLLKCKSLCRIASVCLFVLSVNFAVRPSGEGTCCRTNQRFSLRLKPDMPPSRFLKKKSIRILVDLVIVELYVDKPFSEQTGDQNQPNKPKARNLHLHLLVSTWCWCSISFKLFRHFSYVERSSRFSCQQSRMILCLQIRTKGFIRCCWWSIVKERFLLLKVYRSWTMTTWVTKEMYNKLISRIQIHNQVLTKHYHCVVVLAFCGPVEVVVSPFAH